MSFWPTQRNLAPHRGDFITDKASHFSHFRFAFPISLALVIRMVNTGRVDRDYIIALPHQRVSLFFNPDFVRSLEDWKSQRGDVPWSHLPDSGVPSSTAKRPLLPIN